VEIDITPGQDADITQAEQLLEKIDPDAFLADRAGDYSGYPIKKQQNNTTENGLRSLQRAKPCRAILQ
jgi:hypothetical protein